MKILIKFTLMINLYDFLELFNQIIHYIMLRINKNKLIKILILNSLIEYKCIN